MIQRAVTAIIGVVIGLFATFAVFGAVMGGLDNFYLLTRHTCNYGTESAPDRFLRVAIETTGNSTSLYRTSATSITANTEPEDIDWAYAYDVVQDGSEVRHCQIMFPSSVSLASGTHEMLTPTGDLITLNLTAPAYTARAFLVISGIAGLRHDHHSPTSPGLKRKGCSRRRVSW